MNAEPKIVDEVEADLVGTLIARIKALEEELEEAREAHNVLDNRVKTGIRMYYVRCEIAPRAYAFGSKSNATLILDEGVRRE